MKVTQFGIVFERAQGARLQAAECLLTWFARCFQSVLAGADVAWCERTRTIVAFLRFDADLFGLEERQRLLFWSARSGGRVRSAGDLTSADAARLQQTIDLSDARYIGLAPEAMERAVRELCTAAGLDGARESFADERPVLTLDVGGPRWSCVRWNVDEESLFIASPSAPPVGDPVPVLVRVPGWPRPAVEWTRVSGLRAPEDAEPGHPAGFSLAFDTAPAELRAALASHAPVASYGSRAAPRFQLGVPVRAVLELERPDPAAASASALVGSLENVSLGGAFVRLERGPDAGTELRVRFRLPSGSLFDSRAAVAFRDAHGVGLRFILDRVAMNDLHDALTLLSAHPRRALVIDDDALARKMVADALVERGFEVLTASDAAGGLHLLAEEALAIDLLVTDLILPEVDGEALVATIRRAGGEADLTVVVMTARPDAPLARRLQAAGADLLMGKALGPELIAARADELLEARRHAAVSQRRDPSPAPTGHRLHPAVASV